MVPERKHCQVLVLPTDSHTARKPKMIRNNYLAKRDTHPHNVDTANAIKSLYTKNQVPKNARKCVIEHGNLSMPRMSIEIVQLFKFGFIKKNTRKPKGIIPHK